VSELLPTLQAQRIRESLVDYLTTTFALTDADARDNLDRFLKDPDSGMFKGPYVRLRLPFRPAEPHWNSHFAWLSGFRPYGHQTVAWSRLASVVDGQPRRPLPTVVTTGTGSGKTEAFLYPILDHVLRARAAGETGTKALILYPMNALANDQAARLTKLLTTNPALRGVTAALYTGEMGVQRTTVTAQGLITDREVIRDNPPDILLTNYKMLDQLLLRHEDHRLWRASAGSLRYLVLDEFHTYDGAQGTDVAMLLRRLGLVLKSYWSPDDPGLSDEDWRRPLGRMAPVATSATLGDKGDPGVMLDFARTVFGEEFGPDAVVSETRLSLDEWVGDARSRIDGFTPVDVTALDLDGALTALHALGPDPTGEQVTQVVLAALYGELASRFTQADPVLLLDLCRAHPLVSALAARAGEAVALADLPALAVGPAAAADERWQRFLPAVVAMLSHVRAVAGRDALSVEVHLWARELTRVDRVAGTTARFRWADDGPTLLGQGDADEGRPSFPAVYCRHCGRSGWGVGLTPVGDTLHNDDEAIRRNHAAREGRFRALLYAPAEADALFLRGEKTEALRFFAVRRRELLASVDPDDPDLRDGWTLPVLTTVGDDADKRSQQDTCPSCGQVDAIRFLGSAIATLLSVALSTLFGAPTLDAREKKALVFTDSVQDAAHRAGFVQARSHTLTLRAVLRDAASEGELNLDDLVTEVLRRAGDDPVARYRILPPDLADRDSFASFWRSKTQRSVPVAVRNRVRRRLALDAALEFGLNSRTGRTLELTGSVAVEVAAGSAAKLASIARAALAGTDRQLGLLADGHAPDEVDERRLVPWVRGVLDRMRSQGAIDHPWFQRYRQDDGRRWSIWGGRPQHEGMPAFPRGRPAPAYPRVGGSKLPEGADGLDPVTPPQSWYAQWTSRVLDVSPLDGGRLARQLLDRLAQENVLTTTTSASGATVYAIPPTNVVVMPTAGDAQALVCDTCRAVVPGSPTTVSQLAGAPCLVVACRGTLSVSRIAGNFYQRLYSSPDMRRIVAREHTSLLDDKTRRAYEEGFRTATDDPQAPNVLVATPTLEMGIDIGDLSAVFLASLPRTVASYLQRVGRAGRLTGNALNLAFVTGRGEQLPKLGDPLSVIDGEVRPPATYLRAEEILRRQFTAHLVDVLAADPARRHPTRAREAIGSTGAGTFLGDLIALAESSVDSHLPRFLATFDSLPSEVADALADWVRPQAGPGTSAFAEHLAAASQRWNETVTTLQERLESVDRLLPDLESRAGSPAATDDDKRTLRSAHATKALLLGQLAHLRGEYWIGVLEEYGLLPNYTLVDDSATLDVGLSWIDPDTNEYHSQHATFQRASAHAIREFAPGATFYANGWEIEIDAIDLGHDGAAVRRWAFCPACGFAADVTPPGDPVATCPRCGSKDIADVAQQLDVVELVRVSAEVRRDEASISDNRDERRLPSFHIVPAADVDPSAIVRRWFVEESGLGCTYLRSVDLRWLNLGAPGHGMTRTIAGYERASALFRVCAGCGKRDTESRRNSPHEHRPWCPHRDAPQEVVRTIALSRTLRTQGLLLRLPKAITVADTFAVPSLAAALLLGLREQMGGHPDHIRYELVVEPTLSDGGDNHEAILLHDVVPGGTGYLAETAEPDRLRDLLVRAWERVRDCECQHEDRLACHRCLLPFVPPTMLRRVSRATAERHLRTLLGLPSDVDTADGATWTVTELPPDEEPESHLELRFRRQFLRRLLREGALVTEVPGPRGNTAHITIPGAPRQWTLAPQVLLENSMPDFVLECTDPAVPAVAIFTDGHAYHATATRNRLADDADKRGLLRQTGRIVLAVTLQDLLDDERSVPSRPFWFDESLASTLNTVPPFQAPVDAYKALTMGPITWLVRWILAPAPAAVRAVARAVPMFLYQGAVEVTLPDGTTLAEAASRVLHGLPNHGAGRVVRVHQRGALAVAMDGSGDRVDVAVVLDDRPEVIDDAHTEAWREWLRLSNCLALRDWPTIITTTRLVGSPADAPPPRPAVPVIPAQARPRDAAWAALWDAAVPGPERDLVAALAAYDDLHPPAIGIEGPEGIPLDLSWPDLRIAVDLVGMPPQDRDDLVAVGWQVLPPEPDLVAAAVRQATSTTDQAGERPVAP
jgi:ATP-dependent helicase YprA (DUF1998 family)